MSKEDACLWTLEFWEHDPGLSWVADEYAKLPPNLSLFVKKRLKILRKRDFNHLRKTKDLKKVEEQDYLEITIPKNEIRIFGVIEQSRDSSIRPIFNALHLFHKKRQKIKQKDINLAIKRFFIYKKKKGL